MRSPCRRWTCMSAAGGSSRRWVVLICILVDEQGLIVFVRGVDSSLPRVRHVKLKSVIR